MNQPKDHWKEILSYKVGIVVVFLVATFFLRENLIFAIATLMIATVFATWYFKMEYYEKIIKSHTKSTSHYQKLAFTASVEAQETLVKTNKNLTDGIMSIPEKDVTPNN